MDRTRHVALAVGGVVLTVVCAACAVSSYDDDVEPIDSERSPAATPEGGASPDGGSPAARIDASSTYLPPPVSVNPTPTPGPTPTPSPARDAGSPTPSPTRDAGSPTPTPTPTRDASVTPTPTPEAGAPTIGKCQQDSDCTQECVPVGLFTCCNGDQECGCTWVPGAYCS